jgi:hypothetical protein
MGLTGSFDILPHQRLLNIFSGTHLGSRVLSSASLRSSDGQHISHRMPHDIRISGVSYPVAEPGDFGLESGALYLDLITDQVISPRKSGCAL